MAQSTSLAPGTESGRLVIVGGGLDRTTGPVYQAILSARDGSGPVCIIPTAGAGDPERTIASATAAFEQWGGTAAGIVITTASPEAAHDSAVVRKIRTCSGFYFTGVVQSRITSVFRPDGNGTPAYDALMARFREGAVVAGSSAGAAIMSDPMIAGGSTTDGLGNGVRRIRADVDDHGGAVLIMTGLGFLPSAIVDQHFLARGRIGRLITAVLDLDEYDLGFGIDENTALVVDGDSVHAVGESGVIVIDARDAVRSGGSAAGVKLHLLGVGDAYDMATRRVHTAAAKTTLPTSQGTVTAPDEVFARWTFLHVLHQFAGSVQSELVLPVNGGALALRKGAEFDARANETDGVQGTPSGLSITGLLLDVRR